MDIPLATMLDRLGYEPLGLTEVQNIGIKTVKLITDGAISFEEGCLYVGAQPPEGIAPKNGAASFYCCHPRETENTSVFFGPKCDHLTLFNDVLDLFLLFQEYERELRNIVYEQKELNKLMILCSNILGNPAYLADSSFKIIAADDSPILSELSAIWKQMIETGYISYEIVQNLVKSGELKEIRSHENAKCFSSKFFNNSFINCNIRHNDVFIGHFFIVGYYKKITDGDIALAGCISEIVRGALRLNTAFLSRRGYDYENFFIHMIRGTIHDTNQIERQLKPLSWDIEGRYRVLRLEPSEKDESMLGILCAKLERLKSSKPLIYEGGIAAVFYMRDSEYDELLESELTKLISQDGGYAGLSDTFDGFYRLHWYYMQACDAVGLGGRMRGVLKIYRDYTYHHLFQVADSTDLNLNTLCEKTVFRLLDYDSVHGTQHLLTLETYLKNERSLLLTAKELFIHRNSVIYRINQITELLRLDLNNKDLRMRLLLSFELLRFKQSAQIEKSY